ncbi:hypothetical protein [Mesorhizobium sp. M1027]|uniref:hypothetical protein n=1 Tax=Mesorhizobium sp. M1027 TaxID=2957050 RepID=UPI00333D7813
MIELVDALAAVKPCAFSGEIENDEIITALGDDCAVSFAPSSFLGFHGFADLPAMLSAHGRIESRNIGDAPILDE